VCLGLGYRQGPARDPVRAAVRHRPPAARRGRLLQIRYRVSGLGFEALNLTSLGIDDETHVESAWTKRLKL
jgi:hypothetical protein